jgi:CRISPR-associated protein Cas2
VHPFLGEKVQVGLLPHIQALLLARHIAEIWTAIPLLSGNEAIMMVLVSYDVCTIDNAGKARFAPLWRKRVVDYGQRVQNSVFECTLDPAQWTALKQRLVDLVEPETDSLRFYFMGSNWQHKVEQVGPKRLSHFKADAHDLSLREPLENRKLTGGIAEV